MPDSSQRRNPPSVFRRAFCPLERILAEAVRLVQPVKVFALFSGGHDSLCAALLTSQTPWFDGCVHIGTGIGIEEIRAFDKYAHLSAYTLDRNPVVEKLCMSGECLCGTFARKGELDEIAFWYP